MQPDTHRGADVLIVAAHAPEMAGLRPYLSEKLIGTIRGLQVRAKAVGIGMGVAGPATARGILGTNPRAVLLLGSCGVYPNLPQYRPHDVLVASRIQLVSPAVLAQRAEFPGPMQTQVECDPMLTTGLSAAGGRTFVAPVAGMTNASSSSPSLTVLNKYPWRLTTYSSGSTSGSSMLLLTLPMQSAGPTLGRPLSAGSSRTFTL